MDLAAIGGQRWIFDAIYSPVETELMTRAAEVGLQRISGFDLFIGQAIDAFEIFTGHRLDDETIADMEVRMQVEERWRTLLGSADGRRDLVSRLVLGDRGDVRRRGRRAAARVARESPAARSNSAAGSPRSSSGRCDFFTALATR